MKNILTLLLVAASFAASAQQPDAASGSSASYRGEVAASVAYFPFAVGFVTVETVHGALLREQFFVGGGAKLYTDCDDTEHLALSADFKYLMRNKHMKVRPMFGAAAGVALLDCSRARSYFSADIGMAVRLHKSLHLNLSVGCSMIGDDGVPHLKLGLAF